jgi:hypothetical protein
MHPFTPDLSKLSLEELTTKNSELMNRLNMAYRWGKGDMVAQLQMLAEDYRAELLRRSQKSLEEMESKSKTFKKIIDIQ